MAVYQPPPVVRRIDLLLDRRALQKRVAMDITTIYRKMQAGTFPRPVRIGLWRVAWRESDVVACQDRLRPTSEATT